MVIRIGMKTIALAMYGLSSLTALHINAVDQFVIEQVGSTSGGGTSSGEEKIDKAPEKINKAAQDEKPPVDYQKETLENPTINSRARARAVIEASPSSGGHDEDDSDALLLEESKARR